VFKWVGRGLSALFSRSETTDALVDAAIKTGDALVFTDEERSDASMMLLKLRIEYAKATTGSRLARRVLAVMVTSCYLFWFSVAAGLYIAGMTDAADKVAELLTSLAVGGSFVTIISWYFFAGVNRVNGDRA
jgi:hypothetical protein